jgi:hypothetical protein
MPKQTQRIQDTRRCTKNHVTARRYGTNVLQRARKQGTLHRRQFTRLIKTGMCMSRSFQCLMVTIGMLY